MLCDTTDLLDHRRDRLSLTTLPTVMLRSPTMTIFWHSPLGLESNLSYLTILVTKPLLESSLERNLGTDMVTHILNFFLEVWKTPWVKLVTSQQVREECWQFTSTMTHPSSPMSFAPRSSVRRLSWVCSPKTLSLGVGISPTAATSSACST